MIYTGSATSRTYVQSSSNPLEIFHSLCKTPFTKSEPHRDNPSLVFRNPYNLRDPRSLKQFPLNKKKKKFLSLREGYYN
ncbi:hypothetical protein HKD37_13G036434 [Glycine soja]|nr:hypothetical protein GmHk_13G037047 [Glycine max]